MIIITREDFAGFFEALFQQSVTRPTPLQLRALAEGLRLRPSNSCCCGFDWVLPGWVIPGFEEYGTEDIHYGCVCKTDLKKLLETIEQEALEVIQEIAQSLPEQGLECLEVLGESGMVTPEERNRPCTY